MTVPIHTPDDGTPWEATRRYDQDVERKRREYNAGREHLGLGPGDANINGYTRMIWDALWGRFM